MVEYLRGAGAHEKQSFTFGYVRTVMSKRAQISFSDSEVLDAIEVLGINRVLGTILTFVDPESDEHTVLNQAQLEILRVDGKLYHPDCPDELVDNPESHIVVSFKPSLDMINAYSLGDDHFQEFCNSKSRAYV